MKYWLIFLFFILFSFADLVKLQNGGTLSGQVEKIDADKLYFKTNDSGITEIALNKISSFATVNELYYFTKDKKRYKTKIALAKNGMIELVAPKVILAITQLKSAVMILSPPPKLKLVPTNLSSKDVVKQTGDINIAFNKSTGNANKKGIKVNFSQSVKKNKNRVVFTGKHNFVKNETAVSIDKSNVSVKFDYFFRNQVYVNNYNSWNRDALQDLKIRSSYGLSLGYSLQDNKKKINANFELGLSYVNEDYDRFLNSSINNDDNYIAVRFFGNYKRKVLQEKLILFLKYKMLASAEELSDVIIDSSAGLRFPLYANINATFQLDVDWDSTPVANNSSTDVNYLFTLGYSW